MQGCKDSESFEDCLTRRHAEFCAVFANPVRLKLLSLLASKDLPVSEMAEVLGLSIPHVSQHLRVMREKGCVRSRKAGRQVFYSVSNEKFPRAAELVRQGIMDLMREQAEQATTHLTGTTRGESSPSGSPEPNPETGVVE